MSEKEWLEQRRKCIGATDAAAIIGLSKWRSPYAVWADKVHGIDTVQESERMKWGEILEPVIADEFERWAQENVPDFCVLHDPGRFEIQRHKQYPFIGATLDRELVNDCGETIGVLEIKTTDGMNAKEWKDEPPIAYQVQVQHQLMVTGLTRGWIAVLLGGNQFRVYECAANAKFQEKLLVRLLEFWRLVETETPPEIDGSESTTTALRLLHPDDDGTEIVLEDNQWRDDILYLDELKAKIKEYQNEIAVIENRLKSVIGSATFAHVGDWTYSYKTQERAAHMVKESKFRVLRRAKRKETD